MRTIFEEQFKARFFKELGSKSLLNYNLNDNNIINGACNFYWFPLAKIKNSVPAIAFEYDFFDDENNANKLLNILNSYKINNVIVVPEFDKMFREDEWNIDSAGELMEELLCSEQFIFDDSKSWLIYSSHEFTITFAGEWLVKELKANFDEKDIFNRFYANNGN